MKGMIAIGVAVGAFAAVLACPQAIRAEVADRATIPDHVYAEAERQLDMFVSWARETDSRPEGQEEKGDIAI